MSTELKVVMFTDQVRFTANTARRTHAEIRQVTREQSDLVNEVLRLTRGKFLKDTGDGCLAQFPAVLEAVQAGVLLQKRVAERNAAQLHEQMRFELHIGIDVGDLIVLEDGDLRGEVANSCARICSECPPGDVYLSDTAARAIKKGEVEIEIVGPLPLKGVEGETTVHRVALLRVWPSGGTNPFIWPHGITRAEDVFDRKDERRLLHSFLNGRQNCQIVGPFRIGKTSLLRTIESFTAGRKDIVIARLDLQDPRCFTLSGWLSYVGKQFAWPSTPGSLVDFADRIDEMLMKDLHPVLCLEQVDELVMRREEFTRDFFLTLRSYGQRGVSIITTSRRPLSELDLTDHSSSPFYNMFPLIRLGPFTNADAVEFVSQHRPGVPPFTLEEKDAILTFAKGHPLALQVACFNVLEAKQSRLNLNTAIQKAADAMNALLPDGW